jgi:hypothetical protein
VCGATAFLCVSSHRVDGRHGNRDEPTQLTSLLLLYRIAPCAFLLPTRCPAHVVVILTGASWGWGCTHTHTHTHTHAHTALATAELEALTPTLAACFAQHPSLPCRIAYYDLLAWLYAHLPTCPPALRSIWRVSPPPPLLPIRSPTQRDREIETHTTHILQHACLFVVPG